MKIMYMCMNVHGIFGIYKKQKKQIYVFVFCYENKKKIDVYQTMTTSIIGGSC